MRLIGSIALHRLRTGWRSWAVLVLLLGLAGGAVMAAAAGARRTESAFPRFLRSTAAADVLIGPARSGLDGYDLALGQLPGVSEIAPVVGLSCLAVGVNGAMDQASEVVVAADGRFGRELERPRMLAGRAPRPDRPDEVMIDQIAAQQLRLHPGSRLRLAAVSDSAPPRIRYLTVHVVGVEVLSSSIVPVNILAQTAYIQASAALFRELGPQYAAFDGAYVKLSPGTSTAAFSREATRLANEARYRASTGGQVFVSDESVQDATVERSIEPLAVALAIFGLVLALTALLVIGSAASRLVAASAADNGVLAALGMTRPQLLAASLLQVTMAGTAAAAAAAAIAIAVSPVMPIGPARVAELHPGVSLDATVLIPGFAATVALLVASVAWAAWRESSVRPRGAAARPAAPGYGTRASRWLARSGAPVSAVIGVRLALESGRGRRSVPLHGALIGTALSVAAITAAVTFGANLVHLKETPRLYGQTWDAAVDLQFGVITAQHFGEIAAHVPGVTGWTFGLHGTVTIDHAVVPAIGLAPGRGPILTPTILTGHPMAGRGQLVLGTLLLRHDRIKLGQRIRISASGRPGVARVVGSAIFPYFGQGSFTPTDLGQGAIVSASLLAAEATEANGPGFNFVLLTFASGPGKAADLAAFRRAIAPFCASVQQSTCVLTRQQPNGVTTFARVDATPEILAGLLAVIGLGVLAQFSFQSARFRRRDFAVLRTLGLGRRQLTAVTAWQISTLAVLALLLGEPAGSAAGRAAWAIFARQLGISPATVAPLGTVLILIPAVLLAANLVAAWPGRRTARVSPAELLRAE